MNMNAKVYIAAAAIALAGVAMADWEFNVPASYPYDLKPSAIVPSWSGTNPGEWSFNYEGVMAKAKSEGKYTLLLFSGMWWCPHCQALEENVLDTDSFRQYVAEKGYYLAVADFPYRDGHSNWCWLWDPAYRTANGIGDWTPEQVADELAKRFEFQELMHTQGAATTTNNNVLVQISPDGTKTNLAVYAANPTTAYRRVGYPTIIVIDPDGNEAGRFSYSFLQDQATGLEYVINNIETIKMTEGNDLFANSGVGGIEGAVAQVYDAVLTDYKGVPLGTATFKTAKKSARDGSIKVSASVQVAGGRKIALKGTAVGSEGEQIYLEKIGTAAAATVLIGTEGVSGSFTDGESNYLVQGARNPFKAKDDAAKARAASLQKGFWTFALSNSGSSADSLGRGYSAFSAVAGAKGKFKVTGVLGDGSTVSLSTQALVGENGKVLVPVLGKKGSYSIMLELTGGKLSAVKGVSGWKASKVSGTWSPDAIMAEGPGAGAMPEVMYLQLGGFKAEDGVAGLPVAVSPNDDAILSDGRNWTGTKDVTDLKVSFKQANGTFKGYFNICVLQGEKVKKQRVSVSGVVVDGVPYGAAVIKNKASWPVKLAGSCGGGC